MTSELTEEEAKDPNIVKLNLKPYTPSLKKTTAFFTDYKADQVLKQIVEVLDRNSVTYQISKKNWKLTFTKARHENEETKSEEPSIRESAEIQIELLDAGNNKICVEFKRKCGSSMIFYDWFNTLKEEMAHINNVQI